jgi:hypothetical protein
MGRLPFSASGEPRCVFHARFLAVEQLDDNRDILHFIIADIGYN